MEKKFQKLIVIIGPTASGKSDFAVNLAKQFNGEVISGDSRQVYKGMDLGTGKITKKEMKGIPHHLLDVASPKSRGYNVTKFQEQAFKKIAEIAKKGKIPFLVGGTGFWIDAVAKSQTFPDVKPNPKLRNKLSKLPTPKLFDLLQDLDLNKAMKIDKHNHVRLIRAIEIAKAGKKKTVKEFPKLEVLYLGLDLKKEQLEEKILKRLHKRIRSGMIQEVSKLHKKGVSWKRLHDFGLEYRFIAEHLQGKTTKQEMVENLYSAIKNYVKRQRTWFKSNSEIIWFDPSKKTTAKKAAAKIKKFLKT